MTDDRMAELRATLRTLLERSDTQPGRREAAVWSPSDDLENIPGTMPDGIIAFQGGVVFDDGGEIFPIVELQLAVTEGILRAVMPAGQAEVIALALLGAVDDALKAATLWDRPADDATPDGGAAK